MGRVREDRKNPEELSGRFTHPLLHCFAQSVRLRLKLSANPVLPGRIAVRVLRIVCVPIVSERPSLATSASMNPAGTLAVATERNASRYVATKYKTHLGMLPQFQALEGLVADKQESTHETD